LTPKSQEDQPLVARKYRIVNGAIRTTQDIPGASPRALSPGSIMASTMPKQPDHAGPLEFLRFVHAASRTAIAC
jgi:hypothetical protein